MAMLCESFDFHRIKELDNGEWIFQIKLDGERAIYREGKLFNRRDKDISFRFPELMKELEILHTRVGYLELDGEIVILTGGRPDFKALLSRTHLSTRSKIENALLKNPAVYFVFDILLDKQLSIEMRNKLLQSIITPDFHHIHLLKTYSDGEKLWNYAYENKLEGIIAKRKGSSYEDRRSPAWLKIKRWNTDRIRAVSYESNNRILSTLILESGDRVGSGLSDFEQVKLKEAIDEGKKPLIEIRWLDDGQYEAKRQPTILGVLDYGE